MHRQKVQTKTRNGRLYDFKNLRYYAARRVNQWFGCKGSVLMRHYRCPNDGMAIPQVAEVRAGTAPVRFYWCWSCAELFASVDHSSGDTIAFAEDGQGGWRLFHAAGPKASVQAAQAAVAQVRPDRVAWERLHVSRD